MEEYSHAIAPVGSVSISAGVPAVLAIIARLHVCTSRSAKTEFITIGKD